MDIVIECGISEPYSGSISVIDAHDRSICPGITEPVQYKKGLPVRPKPFSAILASVLLAALLITPVTWAQNSSEQSADLLPANRVAALPPVQLQSTSFASISIQSASPDTVTNAVFLEKLSVLYGYQSDIMAAAARNDDDAIASTLDRAMTELAGLIRKEYVVEDPRFSQVYRTIVDEYERVYGPSDTLFTAFGDIFEVRNELFASLDEVEDPLLEDVAPTGLQPVGTEFPMTMNRLVENSMQFLLRERRESMQAWLSRADTYFPMIEQIFEEEGVPDELKYLAMIESGINPRARSWAAAVGMWQFIAATGRVYDLNVNAWVDDRMDPELSTRAAAKHLRWLYDFYDQDWQIALAGYNCSPRCINRAKRNSGKSNPTFWDIYRYLPRETRAYIPTYIAASLIASNPEAYDLPRISPGPEYSYHIVPVTGMLSLRDVADMASTDVATIKALNPSLKRDTLPPTVGAFYLRIPVGSFEGFNEAFSALPPASKRPSGEYIVRRGDTLSGIGSQFGVSVTLLMQKNSLRTTNIRIGQRLVVPIADYSDRLPEFDLADASQSTIQYRRRVNRPIMMQQQVAADSGTSSGSRTPVQSASIRTEASTSESGSSEASNDQKPAAETRITYTVRRGDTLSEIADRHSVGLSKVRGWNNLTSSRINVGQRLIIYTDGRDAPAPSTGPVTHRVRRGDTLSEIADTYDVTVSQIRQWNNIRGSNIRVDQRLSIYPAQNGSGPQSHVVRRGDTLIEIAQQYGVTVAHIKEWNDLRSNTIRIGQSLKIFR